MRNSLLALLFLGMSGTAFAQLGEVFVSVGQAKARNNSLGVFSADGTTQSELKVESNFRLGVRFAINNEGFFGHEFGYAYTRARVDADGVEYFGMPVHQGMYNFLLYATREGTRVRPFVTGGGHFATFYPPGTGVFSGNGVTKFGFNYGGGLKFRVTDMFSARVDFREYQQGKPDFGTAPEGLLRLQEISAGFGINF